MLLLNKEMKENMTLQLLLQETIFSRESDSTITNVSVSAKPLNSLKAASFIIDHSSLIHPS